MTMPIPSQPESPTEAETCRAPKLGLVHGSAGLVSAVEGYLRNRQTLIERVCELNQSPSWNGYDKAHRDLQETITKIDDRLAALLLPNAEAHRARSL